MKTRYIFLSLVILVSLSAYAAASEGHKRKGSMMGAEHKGSMSQETGKPSPAVEVGNEVCPISGEKTGTMGPAAQYEYKGKIYNFCCDGCVETFKKDPEKYIKKVEEAMSRRHSDNEAEGHEGHQHVMGEKDEHMMMESGKKEAEQADAK